MFTPHYNFSNSELSITLTDQQCGAGGLSLSHIFMQVHGPARDKKISPVLPGLRLTEAFCG